MMVYGDLCAKRRNSWSDLPIAAYKESPHRDLLHQGSSCLISGAVLRRAFGGTPMHIGHCTIYSMNL
eukprot:XP_001709212.1 Hypothetical protein GL50803_3916 [Giardia lamblia ATCC 50803]